MDATLHLLNASLELARVERPADGCDISELYMWLTAQRWRWMCEHAEHDHAEDTRRWLLRQLEEHWDFLPGHRHLLLDVRLCLEDGPFDSDDLTADDATLDDGRDDFGDVA